MEKKQKTTQYAEIVCSKLMSNLSALAERIRSAKKKKTSTENSKLIGVNIFELFYAQKKVKLRRTPARVNGWRMVEDKRSAKAAPHENDDEQKGEIIERIHLS